MPDLGIASVDAMKAAVEAFATEERKGTRLPLRVPIAFRAHGGEAWSLGWTVNVSRSGVLLECLENMNVFEPIEFVIGLSTGVPGACNVTCRGQVIRTEPAAGGHRIAATIDEFTYLPRAR